MDFVSTKQLLISRKHLELNQQQVASAVFLGKSAYCRIEKGTSDPKWSNLKKIIDLFEDKGIIFHSDGNVTKV
jgi:predicted transcriptional regulator